MAYSITTKRDPFHLLKKAILFNLFQTWIVFQAFFSQLLDFSWVWTAMIIHLFKNNPYCPSIFPNISGWQLSFSGMGFPMFVI